MKGHTLSISGDGENNIVAVTGVTAVNILLEKEAQISIGNRKMTVRGNGITANKFDVDEGTLELKAKSIQSLLYQSGQKEKTTFKDLFK